MNDALVSVVVPIYNSKKYIRKCLDSIANQTYKNIEIILINDGSTDGSQEICQDYVDHDERFRLYSIENNGVANARTVGLRKINGEYVCFVDSDDEIHIELIERLYQAICKFDCKLACCDANIGQEEEVETSWKMKEKSAQLICLDKEYDYTQKYAHEVCWGALYHKSIVEGLVFQQDLFVGEDTLFYAQALKRAGSVAYLEEDLYGYIIRSESEFHGTYDDKKFTEVIAWQRLCELFSDMPEQFQKKCKACFGMRCHSGLKKLALTGKMENKKYTFLIKGLRSNLKNILSIDIAVKEKTKIVMLMVCPKIYLRIFQKKNGVDIKG